MAQLTVTGENYKNGEYGMYNINQLKDFLSKKENENKKLIITFQTEEKHSTKSMLAYYFAKIVPEWRQELFKQGTVKTIKQTDKYLRGLSPILENRTLSDLNREELIAFIDHIKDISLQDVHLFIEDPRCL